MDKNIIEDIAYYTAQDWSDFRVLEFLTTKRKRTINQDFNYHIAALIRACFIKRRQDRINLRTVTGWMLRLLTVETKQKVKPNIWMILKYTIRS